LDLNKSEDQLLEEMKPKTRYNIKVAQKHGVQIKINENIEQGIELITHASKRAGVRASIKNIISNC